MIARDLMTAPVITVNPAATVGDAARLMLEHNVSVLPVLDAQEKLAGILTHTDFGLNPRYRPLANNIYTLLGANTAPQHIEDVSRRVSSKPVRDVMRRQVITVQQDAAIADITEVMLRKHIHRVPVMDDDKLVGIITRHDFLKLIATDERISS